MKKLFTILLIFSLSTVSVSAAMKFKDVPASYWAAEHIEAAYNQGIVSGYNATTFKPKANVNRQEAFVMLFRIMKNAGLVQIYGDATLNEPASGAPQDLASDGQPAGDDFQNGAGTTSDVTGADAAPDEAQTDGQDILIAPVETVLTLVDAESPAGKAALEALALSYKEALDLCGFSDNSGMRQAAAYGLQNGICELADFTAGAKTDAPRELIAKWSARALGYETAQISALSYADTASMTAEYMPAIDALYRGGIMVGGTDGKFKPQTGIIRAEISAIAVRMLNSVKNAPAKTLAGSLVCEYGTISVVNTDRNTVALAKDDGTTETLYLDPAMTMSIDGRNSTMFELSMLQGQKATFSCVIGGYGSIIVQTAPKVQTGTVMSDPTYYDDFSIVTIELADGVYNSYVITAGTGGRAPFRGQYVTFIADGAEILEIK